MFLDKLFTPGPSLIHAALFVEVHNLRSVADQVISDMAVGPSIKGVCNHIFSQPYDGTGMSRYVIHRSEMPQNRTIALGGKRRCKYQLAV